MKLVLNLFKLLFIFGFLFAWLSPDHIVDSDTYESIVLVMAVISILFIFPIEIADYITTKISDAKEKKYRDEVLKRQMEAYYNEKRER
jgi:hypothetical protein